MSTKISRILPGLLVGPHLRRPFAYRKDAAVAITFHFSTDCAKKKNAPGAAHLFPIPDEDRKETDFQSSRGNGSIPRIGKD